MNLDRILHDRKHFAELTDSDLEVFLRDRRFRSEHLNLEFKREFPRTGRGNYKNRDICKYIVGFSNEEGGLVVYGVEDSIQNASASYPDYVTGLEHQPSLEDLSQWVKERIYPLVQSPAIRFFEVQGRNVAVLKVPAGLNKPYCYWDAETKALVFFKKTAGGIQELGPEDVGDLFRTAIIEQSTRILRASSGETSSYAAARDEKLEQHKRLVIPKLENVRDFGHVGVYCWPHEPVNMRVEELKRFVETHRYHFSEALRYSPGVEVFQNGVSAGFFPRAIRQDIKSTLRVTLYQEGLVALDAQADISMDRDRNFHPYWFSYELQRHLQLTKALLQTQGVERIQVVVHLGNVEDFVMRFGEGLRSEEAVSPYTGSHEPIERDVNLADIHDYDGEQRNVVIPVVRDIMDEICRIFGFSGTLPGVWDRDGCLTYVRGLENQR